MPQVSTQMQMELSDMNVRIVLLNNLNKAKDDITIILRKDYRTGEYVVSYKDPNDDAPFHHVLSYLCFARAMEYVDLVLKGACVDDDGPSCVQVDCPAMPSILLDLKKVKSDVYYRDHLRDRVAFGLSNIEAASRGPLGLRRQPVRDESAETLPVRQHLFFDE